MVEECNCSLAYIAGYFDGEGYVGIQKTNNGYGIRVELTNTYKPAVLELAKEFGGSVRAAAKRGSRYRQPWQWWAFSASAYNFLVAVLPYLREKAAQAEEVIAFYELYAVNPGRRGRTADERVDQEERHLRIAALKVIEYREDGQTEFAS